MKLEGAFAVAAPRPAVWEAIRDPGVMAPCIPGCESAEPIDDTRYRSVVVVKFGPITARFNLVIEIEEEIAPGYVRVSAKGEEGTRASMVTGRAELTLTEPAPGHTGVAWSGEVAVTGRLAKYGLGLMRKKIESLSAEFIAAFGRKLEAEASAS